MNDYTLESLNLADPSAKVIKTELVDNTRRIHISKINDFCFCENCSSRMRSKGWQKNRIVKGTGVVNGYQVEYVLHQRKWFCPKCNSYHTDSFSFVDPYKQTCNTLPYLIALEMKELNVTAAQVARRYNVSDTYVYYAFLSVVSLARLPLTDIICIDEVFMNYSRSQLYPMVILDFRTGEPIDIVESRRIDTTEIYLKSIPLEERKKVKYIICDMYESYIRFAGTYFPDAVAVVDSFHVIAKINQKIISYINSVKRRYMKEDKAKLDELNYRNNTNHKTKKESREVALLNKYYWLLLKNEDEIYNWNVRKYNPIFGMVMDLTDIRTYFMGLDKNFPYILEMRMKYVEFNRRHLGSPETAEPELDSLIIEYRNSYLYFFRELAETLNRFRKEILASFTTIDIVDPKSGETTKRRLSNGPMESFNNFPKDLKRECNGIKNPEYARNRLLWARRSNPALLAVPKDINTIRRVGQKRRKYQK